MAEIPGMPDVRFYGDAPASVFDRWRHEVFAQARARHEAVSYLALSSGGADGAFGAGFLKGLSESHQRPQFTIVSGVSTGALMAPFVFLGASNDGTLEDLYTSGFAAPGQERQHRQRPLRQRAGRQRQAGPADRAICRPTTL